MNLNLRTIAEKENFAGYLESLKENLFKNDSFTEILKSDKTPYPTLVKQALQKEKLPNNKEGLKIAIESLESKLKLLKQINLTLGFTPDDSTVTTIYSWVKQNLGENIILNIEVKPEILGGVIVSFNGLYSDFSLKKTLENISIEKLLKKYE
jgi:F0F1-type ATP synthase delta subunit